MRSNHGFESDLYIISFSWVYFPYLIMYALVKGELVEAELTLLNVGRSCSHQVLTISIYGTSFSLIK